MTPEEVTSLLGEAEAPTEGPGGVTEADVTSLFQQDDKRKDDTLRGLFDAALTRAPDRHAGILEVARQTKAPVSLVEEHFDEFKAKAEAASFDPTKLRTENTHLVDLLLERPEAAPTVMRDEQLSYLGKGVRAVGMFFKEWGQQMSWRSDLFDQVSSGKITAEQWSEALKNPPARWTLKEYFPDPKQVSMTDSPLAQAEGLSRLQIPLAAYQRSRKGAEVNGLYWKAALARVRGEDGWEYLKQATDLEAQLTPEFYNQNKLEQIGIDVAEALASQVESIKGLGIGGAVGALAGGVAGLVTKNPAIGRAVAGYGLRIGATAGTAITSFEQEAGGIYGELRKTTLDDGTPVSDETALGASIIGGALSAGIETLSLGPLAQAYKPLADAMKARGGREFLKSMMRDKTFINMAADLGKAWVKTAGTEGLEEFLQTQTQNTAAYLSKAASNIQYFGLQAPSQKTDVLGSVVEGVEAAQKGFVGGLAIAAPGPIISSGLSAMRRDKAIAATGTVNAINDAAKTSPTAKAAPELVAKLIEKETADTGEAVTHMYVDPTAFTRLFQSNNSDPNQAAIELMGEDGALELAQAVTTGEKLEIPLATYLENWGSKPIAEALADHTTTKAYHSTKAELLAQEEETQAEASRIAKEYETANPDKNGDFASMLAEDVKAQLAEVGPGGTQAATLAVAPLREFIRTQAERFGVSADELFKDFNIRVQSQAQAEAATAFDFGENMEGPGTQAGGGGKSPTLLDEAQALVSRMTSPERRAQAEAWIAYTQGESDTRPKIDRDLELELAKYGVVDPEGFDYGARAPSLKTAAQRAKKGKGGGQEPAELKKARLARNMSAAEFSAMPRGYFEQGPVDAATQFERALLKTEESIRLYPTEQAVLLDETGRVVLQKTDHQEASVGFTPAQIEAVRSFGVITLTHNHPNGGPLSADDVALAIFGNFKEVRAVTKEGIVFRLKRPEGMGGWGDIRYTTSYYNALRSSLETTYETSLNAARMDMDDVIRAAGGDPKDGRDAKGYSQDKWIGFLQKRITDGWNRFSENSQLGWRVERIEPREAPGETVGDNERADSGGRQSAGIQAAEGTTLFQNDEIGPRGYVEMGQEGAQRLFDIVLTEKADLSTFLHESGHVFLEMMGDLAAREDAPVRVKEDWAKTLEYLGVGSREEIQREHHEKWARSFEAYLFEGNAPSPSLARAFQRFKLWLKSVYRSLVALDVELNPEIRGVFDRLFAADAEIESAKRRMGLAPMFRSPDEAGMNPREWQAYLDSQEKATSRGARATELRVLKDKLRETERWWKEEEAGLYDEALKEFDARPDAKASRYIKKGELPLEDGRTVTEGQMGRIDRQKAYDLVGEARAKKAFGWRLLINGGEDPDGIADLFGFASGQEVLNAVINLPDRKEWASEKARDRMLERHPDILRERGELAEMVAKGLHGDATSEWLLREWKALRSKAKLPVPPIESIKAAAKQIVQRRRVGLLEPGRALQAERSAAQKAAVAAAKQDFAQAAVFKQQQLLNHFLWKELTEAKELREAFEELAATENKDKARARLGKASPVYRDGTDTVLEALGLRTPERRETPAASLNEVVAELEKNGQTITFDSDLIGRVLAQATPWKELTVSELHEVYGYIRAIRQAAIIRTTALIEGKRVDKEKVISELLDDAAKNLPKLSADASSVAARTLVQKGMALFSAADGSLLRPTLMLDWLAGGNLASIWHRAITLPLQQAKRYEAELMKTVMAPIVTAFSSIPKGVRSRFMEKIDGGQLFPSHKSGVTAPSRRFELLVMWMNSGNASNLKRLLEGRGITEAELRAALNLLTKEEMDWCQQVLDSMQALWPLARDLEERDSGLAPEKIEATPIVTQHGTYRGGYFPAVYDRRFANVGERQAGDALASLLDATFTRPGTKHNHLKGRAQDFSDVIALDLSVIHAHLAQAAHDIAFREVIKSVGGLILSPDIQAVLKERLGDGRATVFLQWLKDIGQMRGAEVSSHARAWNSLWKTMRSNFVIGTLGWSAAVALGDLANFAVSATLIKKKHWAAGMLEFAKNPVAAVEFAQSKSGEMRFREGEVEKQFNLAMKSITNQNVLNKGPLGFLRDHAFTFQEWTDKATSTPLWIGAYRQALADGKSDADAVTFADWTVGKAFASHSAVDKAAILRDKGFWGNMTIFYGYLSVAYNLQRDIVHQVHTAMGFKEKALSLPKVSGQLLALWGSYALLSELLTGRGPEEDDGEDELERYSNWAMRKLLLAPLQTIPIPALAGGVESLVLGKRPSVRAAPGYAAVEALFKSTAAIINGEDADEKKMFALARALGLTFGVPTRPLRAAEYLSGAVQGEFESGPTDIASGIVYGPPRNP